MGIRSAEGLFAVVFTLLVMAGVQAVRGVVRKDRYLTLLGLGLAAICAPVLAFLWRVERERLTFEGLAPFMVLGVPGALLLAVAAFIRRRSDR